MNGPMRKKLYTIIVERDGEFCRGCGKLTTEGQLVIDHKDNDNSNNILDNLQLLCRSCNYIKNPRQSPVDMCESESESVIDGTTTEIETNRRKEPIFRKFVYHLVNERDQVPLKEIIYSGSEEVGISPITANRYVEKMCSSRGVLEKVNRVRTIIIRYKSSMTGL